MSNLIPQMTVSEFKQLKAHAIKDLKSVEIMSDGVYLLTVIIPHGDMVASEYIRTQAEYLAVKANISGGQDPDEAIIQPDNLESRDRHCECGFEAKSPFGLTVHKRSHIREKTHALV